jgi:hypothetical protein
MDSGESGYPEFQAPAGLQLEGESGEAMVNWKRKADGRICIVALDGVQLGEGEKEEMEEEKEEVEADPEMDYGAKLDEMAIAEE